jgi:hypothetical protein
LLFRTTLTLPDASCFLAVFKGEKVPRSSGFEDIDLTGIDPPNNTIFLLFCVSFLGSILCGEVSYEIDILFFGFKALTNGD